MNQEGIQVQEYQFDPIAYKLTFYNIHTYSIELVVYAINKKEGEKAIKRIEEENPDIRYLAVGLKIIKCSNAKNILKHSGTIKLREEHFYRCKQIEEEEK